MSKIFRRVMARKEIYQIIEEVKATAKKNEKKEILKNNDTLALRCFLRLQYDPNPMLKHELPKGNAPADCYVDWGQKGSPHTLNTIYKNYYIFLNANTASTKLKKEMAFLKLLKMLDKVEAELLVAAKDKNLKLGLSSSEVEEALPGIFGKQ